MLRSMLAALAVLCSTHPALAMSDADIQPWLAGTSQLIISKRAPNPSILLRHVKVRDSDVSGYLVPDSVTHGFLANEQELLVIPVASGGSMGVNAALLFTSYGGRRRFVGYVPSLGGHLSAAIREGRLETSTPIYGAGDAQCCPSKAQIERFTLRRIHLVKVDAYVISYER